MNNTPISYYGGKTRMLKHILPMIPQHKIYVEPYFGGGAVFFAKGKSYLDVINDTNDNAVNFYRVLKENFRELLNLIEASIFSESLHKNAYHIYKFPGRYSKVKRAWAFWMVTNFSYSNKIGGGWKYCNGTDGSHQAITFLRKKNEFEKYQGILDKAQISNREALSVIEQRDSEDSFFYLDPPYPRSDQGHYKGFKIQNLLDLVKVLETLKGKFLLSNYALPEILDISESQKWHVKSVDMRLSASSEKGRRKTEVLISNYTVQQKLF